MGQIGLWQIIIVVFLFGIFVWPAVRVLHRAGRSRWWVVLAFVPVVNIVLIWVFAFADWPTVDPPVVNPDIFT